MYCYRGSLGAQNHSFNKIQDGGDLDKFGTPMQCDMPMLTTRSKSKSEVEFKYVGYHLYKCYYA